ncbi:hypothetical protein EC957_009945 [Mortierella hygrophila]|uniref:F-box domain-containing protein n=1 Tax=Mortierella hygrophila TaxID=979708 RepID=A0A9P6K4P3_9FUNG|nr:hypothetical protein EC957_009945 [Mortierella hygrophila]
MASTAPTRNPFNLPELIIHLSQFVTDEDAISCALVSQIWTDHFVSVIWYKVDFNTQPRFADLSPAIILKHGHHIRVIKNAKTLPHANALAHPSINQLTKLHIETATSPLQNIRAHEIIFRNNHSLERLDIVATSTPANKQDSLAHCISAPALSPPSLHGTSRLTNLKLDNLVLTHDTLVAVLQICPSLSKLQLFSTDIIGRPTTTGTLPYQHKGIRAFGSPLNRIFPVNSIGFSLLSHFPNLTTLYAWNYDRNFTVPVTRIKKELAQHCPGVTGFHLADSTGALVTKFLTTITNRNVDEFVFRSRHTSLELIKTVLLHQTTMRIIMPYCPEECLDQDKNEVAPVTNYLQESSSLLQLIPRACPELDTLDLYFHEMDMDDVEAEEWICKNLTTLRMRIKGLDTAEKILKVIALWRKGCWRRWQKKAGTPVATDDKEDETDMSIEARVARHLLKFDKLWTVWLGYQTWAPI